MMNSPDYVDVRCDECSAVFAVRLRDASTHGSFHCSPACEDAAVIRRESATEWEGSDWFDPAEQRHDYEPSGERHAMHTDPLCAACGAPKKDPRHD